MQAYGNIGGIELAKSVLNMDIQIPMANPQIKPTRCICTKCRSMDQMVKNICCRQKPCVTTTEIFNNIVLNRDVLSVAIVDRHDVLVEAATYTPQAYRKSAYHQWIMWRIGYLGNGVRHVVPSCVVWAVRDHYPAPDGCYLGFKSIE
ncbi:P2X purinoceptor 7-like [Dysidea avara]|uniref:P2X purinoceptor 7-like n=1 Tax=Dysidea avara TaxID=196820 RepID=UPI003318304D